MNDFYVCLLLIRLSKINLIRLYNLKNEIE